MLFRAIHQRENGRAIEQSWNVTAPDPYNSSCVTYFVACGIALGA